MSSSNSPDVGTVSTDKSGENKTPGAEGTATTEHKHHLTNEFFYPADESLFSSDGSATSIFNHPPSYELKSKHMELVYCFGFQSHKRSNLFLLDDKTLLTSVGNVLLTINMKTLEQKSLIGLRNGSIGSIAVDKDRKFIAVAEVYHTEPNIYVFDYPSMRLHRILRAGAVRGYSDLCFNNSGDKIASVSMDPDYMLTIWNWKQELITLRSKAFSQDIYKVAFSSESDGMLTTSGMGHIKFWQISSTFTGLKLMGQIGKFGLTELTDVAAFIQLPDGKVVSSTETGNLLLWEGGFIKCELTMKGRRPCHAGKIEVVLMHDSEIITAGDDGFIRIWDFEVIDAADISAAPPAAPAVPSTPGYESSSNQTPYNSNPRTFEMDPTEEIFVGKHVKVKTILWNSENADMVIQDENGHVIRIDAKKRAADKVLAFHSGNVLGLVSGKSSHSFVSLGEDGTLRTYDYQSKNALQLSRFTSGGSYLTALPNSLDSKGATYALGFADGVVRIVTQGSTSDGRISTSLQYAYKPHKMAVSHIAISYDGNYMVSTSDDKAFFFFSFSGHESGVSFFHRERVAMKPIGFVQLATAVKDMSFAPTNETSSGYTLHFTDTNGTLKTLSFPKVLENHSQLTFELPLDLFTIRSHLFDNIPAPPKPAPPSKPSNYEGKSSSPPTEEATTVVENAETRTLSALRRSRGLGLAPDSGIDKICFVNDSTLLISLVNSFGEGEIRAVKIGTMSSSRLLLVSPVPFTHLGLSKSKNYILVGSADGSTILRHNRARNLNLEQWKMGHETFELMHKSLSDEMGRVLPEEREERAVYWAGHSHNYSEKVLSVETSFDDSFIFSSGSDGGFFCWRNTLLPEVKENGISAFVEGEAALKFLAKNADDVSDNAYTIQEHKLKAERDKELQSAEQKKQDVRFRIQEFRERFQKLMVENSRMENPLPRDLFVVDPYLKAHIDADTLVQMDIARKELQWISEKETIGPEKLKRAFLDPLQTELIVVNAFKSEAAVSTFRTLRLDQKLPEANSSDARDPQADHIEGVDKAGKVEEKRRKSITIDPKGKLEAKKQQRLFRAQQLKTLMEEKPDDKYEDPNDVQAIRLAIQNMGDYKLKSAKNYIVPDGERVDADKKKKQILLLKESIFVMKEQFNARVLKKRESKESLSAAIKELTQKIVEINKELVAIGETSNEAIWLPATDSRAYPENRNVITEADVEEQIVLDNESMAKARGGGDNDLMNAFGAGVVSESGNYTSISADVKASENTKSHAAESTAGETPPAPSSSIEEKSPLELAIIYRKKTLLHFRKSQVYQKIELLVKRFDEDLIALLRDRMILQADLKAADLKLLLLYREWALLKEFEKHDIDLSEKLKAKLGEKHDIHERVVECQSKLATKKAEIELVLLKGKELVEDFQKNLGENNKYEDFYLKVFRRKVKRSKKRASEKGEDEEEEDSSDSEEEDDDSDDDEEDFVEKAPADTEIEMFQSVLALRERKLDLDDKTTEIQKVVEVLKKENDSLLKKEKVIDHNLSATEAEIQEFQTLKQCKLNELDVVVPIQKHQIQYFENQGLTTDVSQGLIFLNSSLVKLKGRIAELKQEKEAIRSQHKELKKSHVLLIRSREEKQQKLQELTKKLQDVQMLKFGKLVDIEKLEKVGVNKNADELAERLQKDEELLVKRRQEADGELAVLKDNLVQLTKLNTQRLEEVVRLTELKNKLEQELDNSQKSVTAEFSAPNKKDVEERHRLLELVHSQKAEIESLKSEIQLLVKKPTGSNAVRSYTAASLQRPPAREPSTTMTSKSRPFGLSEESRGMTVPKKSNDLLSSDILPVRGKRISKSSDLSPVATAITDPVAIPVSNEIVESSGAVVGKVDIEGPNDEAIAPHEEAVEVAAPTEEQKEDSEASETMGKIADVVVPEIASEPIADVSSMDPIVADILEAESSAAALASADAINEAIEPTLEPSSSIVDVNES